MAGYSKPFLYIPRFPNKYRGTLPIILRSQLERKFARFVDLNEKVKFWGSESAIIQYLSPVDHRIHRYFIDFFIIMKAKKGEEKILVEIKPDAQCHKPERGNKKKKTFIKEAITFAVNQAKWSAAKEWAKKRDWKFKIITDKDMGMTN